jgi:phosphate transport system substrate-binding protein
VSKKAAATKPEVAKFIEFYQDPKNAVELVKEVGYVPLPEEALKVFQKRFADREIGTGFTGSKVGISVDDLPKEKLVY